MLYVCLYFLVCVCTSCCAYVVFPCNPKVSVFPSDCEHGASYVLYCTAVCTSVLAISTHPSCIFVLHKWKSSYDCRNLIMTLLASSFLRPC